MRDNLCHGDLHAGNLLFDQADGPVVVLDAGLTTRMSRLTWCHFRDMLKHMCRGDVDQLTQQLEKMNVNETALHTPRQKAAFRQGVQRVVSKWVDPSWTVAPSTPAGGTVPFGDLMGQLLFCMTEHRVRLPCDVGSSITTLALFEGVIKQLDPNFDIVRNAIPYFVRYNSS